MRIAAATPSGDALAAALTVGAAGGGAVDAAIAAAATAMVTEVGVCAPGAGGFLTVADGDAFVTYDGYVAVPGLGGSGDVRPQATEVSMGYGGGITTLIGPASIATPGIWHAMDQAHRRHGRLEWSELLEPAVRLAAGGFAFGRASMIYLRHSHHLVYGHDPASRAVIHHPDGTLKQPGETIVMPDLARSLRLIGELGSPVLHGGELARRIATDLHHRGARLTYDDLASYRAEIREPLTHTVGGWDVATNPAPAIGGQALIAVLEHLDGTGPEAQLRAQQHVFSRRAAGDPLRSGSTIQVSVVDEAGVACSLTASSGYGSGVIPAGTGMWMNNALGELELIPDPTGLRPGERLVSNMAPTVAKGWDGSVLAIGSPGADRITSALAQVISSFALDAASLDEAVRNPRLHVELADTTRVSVEPGLELQAADVVVERFDALHMYFGGVAAAMRCADGTLLAVADPRRDGASGVG